MRGRSILVGMEAGIALALPAAAQQTSYSVRGLVRGLSREPQRRRSLRRRCKHIFHDIQTPREPFRRVIAHVSDAYGRVSQLAVARADCVTTLGHPPAHVAASYT